MKSCSFRWLVFVLFYLKTSGGGQTSPADLVTSSSEIEATDHSSSSTGISTPTFVVACKFCTCLSWPDLSSVCLSVRLFLYLSVHLSDCFSWTAGLSNLCECLETMLDNYTEHLQFFGCMQTSILRMSGIYCVISMILGSQGRGNACLRRRCQSHFSPAQALVFECTLFRKQLV